MLHTRAVILLKQEGSAIRYIPFEREALHKNRGEHTIGRRSTDTQDQLATYSGK